MKEQSPLQWPEGYPRMLLGDRQSRPAWKKTEPQAIEILEIQLRRFGVIAPIITRKDPQDFRTAPDPSIAVWFSRKPKEEDFSWQNALRIDNPAPSIEEIEAAFRKLAQKFHPDNLTTGDIETYHALDNHKKNALAYVNQLSGASRDFCIPCDNFKLARWNITAISNTIRSLRQMERDGTSALLERAMTAFKALPERIQDREVGHVVKANSAA